MAGIKLIGVTKRFGDILAVDKTDLSIEDKEFVVLVGPSGCGKTTTLRMIAGLEQASEGDIYIGERNVNDVLPKDRDISMVFQSYALYPHMNVFRNIGFGLRIRRFPKEEIKSRVREAAVILGIEDLLERKPKELSGGQRQRVAMGRAIVRHPQAFLFDEPLSNLDAKLRVQMRGELAKLHQRLETTVVYVTHDQIEAMTLADRIVVMCAGIIKQIGCPLEVYNQPRDLFVAGFIGSPTMNLFPVEVIKADGRLFVVGDGFKLAVPPGQQDRFAPAEGRPSVLGLRPEHFHETGFKEPFAGGETQQAVIDVVEPVGSEVILLATCGRSQLTACVDPETRVRPGDKVEFLIDMNRMHLFDQATEQAY